MLKILFIIQCHMIFLLNFYYCDSYNMFADCFSSEISVSDGRRRLDGRTFPRLIGGPNGCQEFLKSAKRFEELKTKITSRGTRGVFLSTATTTFHFATFTSQLSLCQSHS